MARGDGLLVAVIDQPRFIRIPEAQAEKMRLRGEARRQANARYNAKRPNRDRGSRGKIPLLQRNFIVWDGEGPQDTGYSLLGNSEGDEICYPHLRTRDCLDLFLGAAESHPQAIHVGFGFNYDVSCILWELSWRHLTMLRKFNRTVWRDYEIEHIPRKWFSIKRGHISIKIFDVHSFFASSLVTALETWRIGPWNVGIPTTSDVRVLTSLDVPSLDVVTSLTEKQLVETFKKLRAEFLWKDIESIRLYMRLELKYTRELMNELRSAFANANYIPKSWHGPGAIARMAFKRHNIYDALSPCPMDVNRAARYAFVAGRFELFIGGHVNGNVYTADINSAYPFYCSQLPNLAKGKWRATTRYEDNKFGIYKIRYESDPDMYGLFPLPFRDKKGMIAWPHRVTGWYWNPEAALVADDKDATFLEGWVFDEEDSNDRPFAFLIDYYNRRKKLKSEGNPAEYTFKLIINSIYGQLAQRVGWDKKTRTAPKTHQLEYAGWITSSCRAAAYRVAKRCGPSLVSIDTDGVTSLQPFAWLRNSKELGKWELDQYDDGIFWQSGIYTLKEGDTWTKAKTRGIPKGSYTAQDLISALPTYSPLRLTKKVFIAYGLALQGQREMLNKWKAEPHEFKFGGGGKRQHIYRQSTARYRPNSCNSRDKVYRYPNLHRLALPPHFYGPFTDSESCEHKLPWINSEKEMGQKDELDTLVFYDTNDLDFDDEWARGYDG
jgi:hypothetical protein